MKHTIIVLALLVSASAQAGIPDILQCIEDNSPTLAALRARRDASQAQARTGLAPANPEVEFGRLWGSPSTIGARHDVSLSQELDFPTVYRQTRKRADEQAALAEAEYQAALAELLLSAEELCIELVHQNALTELLGRQAAMCDSLAVATQQSDATQLDVNRARLSAAVAHSQLQAALTQRDALAAQLTAMAGTPVALPDTDLQLIAPDAQPVCASARLLVCSSAVAAREVSVARAAALPRLKVGYMGEYTLGQRYQGLTLGMSIPLWQDRGRTAAARLAAQAAAEAAEDARRQHLARTAALGEQVRQQRHTADQLADLIAQTDNSALLALALRAGQMTLQAYLTEAAQLLEARKALLSARRDLALTLARLRHQ